MKKHCTDSADTGVESQKPRKRTDSSFPKDVEKLLRDAGFKRLAYQEVLEAEAAERARLNWRGILTMATQEPRSNP